MTEKIKKNNFIEKAKKIHGSKYNYSLVKYNDSHTKIKIICPKHGIFEQKPANHISGQGCKKCANEKLSKVKKLTTKEFIERSKKIHNNKYDYSLVIYRDGRLNVKIICPKHGIFEQKAKVHLYGSGCKKCINENLSKKNKLTTEEFIKKAKKIHGDKYDYSLVKYTNNLNNIKIICPKHGVFEQKPRDHLQNKGCQKCSFIFSKNEKDIISFLNENKINNIIENSRKIISPYELDIYLPDFNLAIEYCGLYWHSEKFIDKNYHLNKLKLCNDNNIRLITIFEDEWINKKNIIKNKLKSILNIDDTKKIYGRNCEIKEINSTDFNNFLNMYHIQGKMICKFRFGLFHMEELVAVLGFRNDKRGYDLNRYATKYRVIGGFSKLLKFFIKKYDPNKIFTFADLRYSDEKNNLYLKNGFTEIGITKPNYFYVKNNLIRYSRVEFQKHKLKNKLNIYNPLLTEVKNMENNGYYRIFDCGNLKYEIIL